MAPPLYNPYLRSNRPQNVLDDAIMAQRQAGDFLGRQFPRQKFTQARKALVGNRQLPGWMQNIGSTGIGAAQQGWDWLRSQATGLGQMAGTQGSGASFAPNRSLSLQPQSVAPANRDMAYDMAVMAAPGTPSMDWAGYSGPSTYRPLPPTPGAPAGTPGFAPNRSIPLPPSQSDFFQRTAAQLQAGQQAGLPPQAAIQAAPMAAPAAPTRAQTTRDWITRRQAAGSPEAFNAQFAATVPTIQPPSPALAMPRFSAAPEQPSGPLATMDYGERLGTAGMTRSQRINEMLARPEAMDPETLAGMHSYTPGAPGLADRRDLSFAEWTQAQAAGMDVGPWAGPSRKTATKARPKGTWQALVGKAAKGDKAAQKIVARGRARMKKKQTTGLPQAERDILRIARARGERMPTWMANVQATINRGEPLSEGQQQQWNMFRQSREPETVQVARAKAENLRKMQSQEQAWQGTPEGRNALRAMRGELPEPVAPTAAPGTPWGAVPEPNRPAVQALVEAKQWPQLLNYVRNTLGWDDEMIDENLPGIAGIVGASAAKPGGPASWFRQTFLKQRT